MTTTHAIQGRSSQSTSHANPASSTSRSSTPTPQPSPSAFRENVSLQDQARTLQPALREAPYASFAKLEELVKMLLQPLIQSPGQINTAMDVRSPSAQLQTAQQPRSTEAPRNEPSFDGGAMLEVAADLIPAGYKAIHAGSTDHTVLAVPTDQVALFTSFLNAAAGSAGSYVGGQTGRAVGNLIDANPSQTAALETTGAAFGGAAATGAMAAATGTGAAAGVGAGALAGAAAAWPAAVVIAAYTQFMNIRSMKKAVGGGALTDDEVRTAMDAFGLEKFMREKAQPEFLEKLLPKELDYLQYPHQLIGKLLFGSGKHEDQIMRDRMRTQFEKLGFAQKIDGSHNIQLADGTFYDIGKDGRTKLTNLDGTERRPYNTDHSNPFTSQVIGWVQPIAFALAGGNEKLGVDFTGYLTNAALSNATTLEDARQNALTFLKNCGVQPAQLTAILTKVMQEGKMPEDVYRAHVNGLTTLMSGTIVLPGLDATTPLEEYLKKAAA